MKLFDVRHPFFLPTWRRAATCAVTAGWGLFEFLSGNVAWSLLFGAIALYCFYEFFLNFDPDNYR